MLLKQMKEDADFNMDKEYETMIGIMLKNYLPIEWMRYTMFHIMLKNRSMVGDKLWIRSLKVPSFMQKRESDMC